MDLSDYHRRLGRAWTALQHADNSNRAARLRELSRLFDGLAYVSGMDSDNLTAEVLFLLADVEDVASGRIPFRQRTCTVLEPALGPTLERMALTRDVAGRAALLADLALELDNDETVETLACMPYADNRSGWTANESWPSERTLRGFLGALKCAWRERRAV